MPIYEYICEDCGTETELFFKSISAGQTDVRCDHCGSSRVTRKFSLAGVSMGSGSSTGGFSPQSSTSGFSGSGGGCSGGACGCGV